MSTPELRVLLAEDATIVRLARVVLGEAARPVRAVLFDKRPDCNWALGWHQDRTIVVNERVDVPDFCHWTMKSGLQHVEPPFAFLERMITLRAHLDPCPLTNAPLLVLSGSHRRGRIPVGHLVRVIEEHETMVCEAEPGDIWLYATPVVHASKSAEVPGQRRVLQIDFSADQLPGGLSWLGV